MALSASLMMGTKQLQYPETASGSGTPNYCMTVTSSGETMISLLGPRALLRDRIILATVRGVARQFSISRSTPSRPQVRTIVERAAMKLLVLVGVAKTFGQLPFCPPTEITTFLPLAFHLEIRLVGKLASSAITLPSGCVLTKARMTVLVLGFTSSSIDCPQKVGPKPQQNILMSQLAEAMVANSRSATRDVTFILKQQYISIQQYVPFILPPSP